MSLPDVCVDGQHVIKRIRVHQNALSFITEISTYWHHHRIHHTAPVGICYGQDVGARPGANDGISTQEGIIPHDSVKAVCRWRQHNDVATWPTVRRRGDLKSHFNGFTNVY